MVTRRTIRKRITEMTPILDDFYNNNFLDTDTYEEFQLIRAVRRYLESTKTK